ncbi:MAG: hypothetical protein JXR10_15715 [Cyclobacteriaceae bacterium]
MKCFLILVIGFFSLRQANGQASDNYESFRKKKIQIQQELDDLELRIAPLQERIEILLDSLEYYKQEIKLVSYSESSIGLNKPIKTQTIVPYTPVIGLAGKQIATLQKGTHVLVLGYEANSGKYIINHNSSKAYVQPAYLKNTDRLIEYVEVQKLKHERFLENQRAEEHKIQEQKLEEKRLADSLLKVKIQKEEALKNEERKKRLAEKKKIAEKERERRTAEILNKFGKSDGNKILRGEIWIGMSEEMAIESQGYPIKKNRTVNSYNIREQWIYDQKGTRTYLYFVDGVLRSYQD